MLGCETPRDNGACFDVVFYGHQITIHQATDAMPANKIDHFGPILSKQQWLLALELCKKNKVKFVSHSRIDNEGEGNESGRFLINDPGGNIIEFKYYQDLE